MKHLLIFVLGICLLTGCSTTMSESEIEAYVQEKMDESQIYDIVPSPKYSKENEIYQVVSFEQEEELIMYSEELGTDELYCYRSIFYKDDQPVHILEYLEFNDGSDFPYVERKYYLNGINNVIAGYERVAADLQGLDAIDYEQADLNLDGFDFPRLENAITQSDIFDMRFGEFLSLPGETYLILENPESEYNVAYMVLEGDALVDQLYENPEAYKGKSILVYPAFKSIGGIDRMIYTEGTLK